MKKDDLQKNSPDIEGNMNPDENDALTGEIPAEHVSDPSNEGDALIGNAPAIEGQLASDPSELDGNADVNDAAAGRDLGMLEGALPEGEDAATPGEDNDDSGDFVPATRLDEEAPEENEFTAADSGDEGKPEKKRRRGRKKADQDQSAPDSEEKSADERIREANIASARAAEERLNAQRGKQVRMEFEAQWERIQTLKRANRTLSGTLTAIVPMSTANHRTVMCAVATIDESAIEGSDNKLLVHIPAPKYFFPPLSLDDASVYLASSTRIMGMSESDRMQWLSTRMLTGRLGEQVRFRVTDMRRQESSDSNIDHYIITGDRMVVQERLVHQNFEGTTPRLQCGDLVECRVVGVSMHRARLDIGGFESRVERQFLSMRFIDDVRKMYKTGDSIICPIVDISYENDKVQRVLVDPRHPEMQDILDRGRFNAVQPGSYATATITSGFIDPASKQLTYLIWIDGLEVPGRASRVAVPTTLKVQTLEPGTKVQVRVLKVVQPNGRPERTRVIAEIRKILN